ncbi:MAG TPA: RDD family protein [Rhodanobacteraceae bacterium]|nr:RDD family protein [Rhodanobacteraceae bacterium]
MTVPRSSAVPVPRVPLWRRFAAMVYDLLPLLGLWIIGSALWMLAFHRSDSPAELAGALRTPADRILRDVWLLAITGAYFVVSWTRVGATIGMRAWKFKLTREDGGRIGWLLAWKRFILALVSLVLLGAGFWYAWSSPERRAWHDRMCGTRAVRF